jgi:hypothetical protein
MVEVAAEARQGDSGGPIFNERLELAGVLFGAANGTTSGSYSGRVLSFLQGVMPAAEAPVAVPQASQISTQLPSASATPAADAHLFAAPQVMEGSMTTTVVPMTEQVRAAARNLAESGPVETSPRQLMPLPERNGVPLSLVNGEEPLAEDRTALRPTPSRGVDPHDLSLTPRQDGPIAADALNVMHNLPSRVPTATPLETAPADQLIAAAWKQIGGSSLFDQGKTLLAVLGLLGLLIQFWRLNSRPDPADED